MSIVHLIKCDFCKLQGDVARFRESGFIIKSIDEDKFEVRASTEGSLEGIVYHYHCCGIACALKQLSQLLADVNRERNAPPVILHPDVPTSLWPSFD